MRPLLYTLAPSHYCERARWALDRAGVAYEEVRLAPGLHVPRVKRLGAPGSSLPVLALDGGRVIQGSDAILDWTGMPGDDADLEGRLATRTAPLVRQCLYAGLLNDAGSGVRDVLLRGVDRRQAAAGRVAWPVVRRLMIAGMAARAARLPELIARVDAELDWFDGVLAERGERLAGDEFGRADLSAASLFAPLALPQVPPLDTLYAGIGWPAPLADALARWAARPSLRWVTGAYARHRAATVA